LSEDKKRSQAWVGDAVLALYARRWILRRHDIVPAERAEVFIQMTSNHFLASLGEPTAMEAAIGVVYEREGLEAAFTHIETTLLPVFKKHRARSKRPGSYRDKR
jgi:dsRNA-specific ribonuclease